MLGSKCDLKMHVRNLEHTLPYKSWVHKQCFFRLRNVTTSSMTHIFGTKHDIHNVSSALTTTGVSYVVSKCHELWSTNSLKLDQSFYPHYANSAFYFIASICSRTPANVTQPNFVKWCIGNRANNPR